MEGERAHLYIHGKVQGVYYRASALDTAIQLGITGWVRNLPNGSVEIVAEGSRKQLNQFIEWCKVGPPGATVSDINVRRDVQDREFSTFKIEY